MNKIYTALAKQQSSLFKVSYTPGYSNLIPHHVIADRAHPLYETQKRRLEEKKKVGLWWHVTSGNDLSKSSCVRTWARRRLRQALLEELKVRGYNEKGKRKPEEIGKRTPDLKGSLRLHIQLPLVSAKFEDVKAEIRKVIDTMVQAAKADVTTFDAAKGERSWKKKATQKPIGKVIARTLR